MNKKAHQHMNSQIKPKPKSRKSILDEGLEKENKSDTRFELAKMKLSLVEKDYESYFQASTRGIDRVNQRRNLEITLVSAITVVLISTKNISQLIAIPIYFLLIIFYLLDIATRSVNLLIGENALKVEQKLQTTNIDEFLKNIEGWTFGNTLMASVTFKRRMISLLKASISLELILWHGGLVSIVSGLLWVLFVF